MEKKTQDQLDLELIKKKTCSPWGTITPMQISLTWISPLILAAVVLTYDARCQWEQCVGIDGGIVSCLAVNGSTLLAGTPSEGLFRRNGGDPSWSVLDRSITGTNVAVIGTGNSSIWVPNSQKVWVSSDNGETWNSVQGLQGETVSAFGFGVSTIIAGTTTGRMLFSQDGGNTWVNRNTGIDAGSSISEVAINTNGIFVWTSKGLFRSSDSGATWQTASSGLANFPRNIIYSMTGTNTDVYVGTGNGVYSWSAATTSWVRMATGGPLLARALLVTGTTLFASSGSSLYRYSLGSGGAWSSTMVPLRGSNISDLATISGSIYCSSSSGGVLVSTDDAATWASFNEGIRAAEVNFCTSAHTALYVGTAGMGLYRSTDGGGNWVRTSLGLLPTFVSAVAQSGPLTLAGTNYEGLFQSSDNGNSWESQNLGLPMSGLWALQESGGYVVAATQLGGVFRSTEGSNVWTQTTNSYFVLDFAQSTSFLYAVPDQRGIMRSSDHGGSWEMATSGLTNLNVIALAVRDSLVLAGTRYGGLFRSYDAGGTWTKTAGPFESREVRAIAMYYTSWFVGTDNGLLRSSDQGMTWEDITADLRNRSILSLAILGQYLYAGTMGSSLWRRLLSGLVAVQESSHVKAPVAFSLATPYPNPFNPSTTIQYALPSRSHVALTISNTLGQAVKELVRGEMEAGYHEVQFDASGLASGVYFVRFEAGDWSGVVKYVSTNKILMMK